jgi:DNA polymerase-3 subunit epsilon
MAREIVLDTETTGFEPQTGHRLVEIGCLEIVDFLPTGRLVPRLYRPERDMPPKPRRSTACRRLPAGKPKFQDIATAFLDFVGDAP